MVGFEWSANPILWSYTTIHTVVDPPKDPPPDSQRQRVLIVESDAGIARALAWCVNQQAGLVGVVCDSQESFEEMFAAQKPHIVLLNRNFAGRVGFDPAGQTATLRSNVPALAYSCAMDGDQLFASTPGGAEGYLLKRVKPERIFEPILDLSGRPDFAAHDLLARVKNYFKALLQSRSVHESSALAKLTPREREVLALLSKGCVDKEIASALGISAWTVHGHIKKIFERLQVRTRTEAVVRYLEK
jgi:DNA-binding NarL/FixJ family response regulator